MAQARPLSRPCKTCKTRRVKKKCDEARPICQRCSTGGRDCVYAADFDLVHRDETRRTLRRFARDHADGPSSNHGGSGRGGGVRGNKRRAADKPAQSATAPPVRLPSQLPAPKMFPGTTVASTREDNLAAVVAAASTDMPDTMIFIAGEEVDPQTATAISAIAASGSMARWRRVQIPNPNTMYAQAFSRSRSPASTSTLSPLSSAYGTYDIEQVDQNHDSANSPPRPSKALTMPLGQLALCYFAANFMLLSHTPNTGGFFEYILPVLHSQPPDSPLQYALHACAFAAMGNRWVSDRIDFNAIALSQYTAALTRTTMSLQDKQQSKADTTLATVLLLGLFESITDRTELAGWQSHIAGAVHLVQSRGPKRLQTRTEKLLFNAVRLQFVTHSFTADTPETTSVNWWFSEDSLALESTRCQRFALETGQLRLEMSRLVKAYASRLPRDKSGVRAFLLRVYAIDNEAAAWMVSAASGYRTMAMASDVLDGDYEHADVFPGRIDIYTGLYSAYMWSMMRCCRLVLSSLIVRCLALLEEDGHDFRTTPAFAVVERRCKGFIVDIIASVPYFLGTLPVPAPGQQQKQQQQEQRKQHVYGVGESASSAEQPRASGFACGEEHGVGRISKALSGLLLIWPLTASFTHDATTDAQRAFLIGRLRHIGQSIGVRSATACTMATLRYPSMLLRRDQMIVNDTASSIVPETKLDQGTADMLRLQTKKTILQLRSPKPE